MSTHRRWHAGLRFGPPFPPVLGSVDSPFPACSACGPAVESSTPLGQLETLTIGSWPDGANQRVEVSVPDGHAIKSLDLDIEASTLNNPMGSVLTDVGDFDRNAVYDGMDVNKSSLQILPQDWSYDFEAGVSDRNGVSQAPPTGRFVQTPVWVVRNSPRREPSVPTKNRP